MIVFFSFSIFFAVLSTVNIFLYIGLFYSFGNFGLRYTLSSDQYKIVHNGISPKTHNCISTLNIEGKCNTMPIK